MGLSEALPLVRSGIQIGKAFAGPILDPDWPAITQSKPIVMKIKTPIARYLGDLHGGF